MSHQFMDAEGRFWRLLVNVGSIKACRKDLGIDLLQEDAFEKIASDPILLADILWELVDKSRHPDITAEQFGNGLSGNAIEDACDAFAESMFDFFPKGRRELSRSIYRRLRETQREILETAAKAVQDAPISPETKRLLTS